MTIKSSYSRFFDSLQEWLQQDHLREATWLDRNREIGQVVAGWFDAKDERDLFVRKALDIILRQLVVRTYNSLEVALEACRTELQEIMLIALTVVGREKCESVYYYAGGRTLGDSVDGLTQLGIRPAATVEGGCQLDFLLSLREIGPDYSQQVSDIGDPERVGTIDVTTDLGLIFDLARVAERPEHKIHNYYLGTEARTGKPIMYFDGAYVSENPFEVASVALDSAARIAAKAFEKSERAFAEQHGPTERAN